MQDNTPRRRSTRTGEETPQYTRQTVDYQPRKRKSKAAELIPLVVLFAAALVVMYAIFPKQAGRSIGPTVYDGLVISEVMAANSTAVPDENGDFSDWLELYNGTGQDLDLEGVMLTNRTDRVRFTFPAYTLKAGEYVVIFCTNSYQMDPSKPFHAKMKISSAGDHIYLYSPDLYLIDELATPTLTSDTSYIYQGEDDVGERIYSTTSNYSPGYENTQEGFVAYRDENRVLTGSLVINEVCPDPKIGIPDDSGEIVDWIELYNAGDTAVNLSNYYLSDKENRPLKWKFPDGAVIAPGGYYLVYCSGKDYLQSNGVPHTNFSLSAERETVVLSNGNGQLVDRMYFENIPEDYSYGRTESGELQLFQLSTPMQPNNIQGQAYIDTVFQAYNYMGVIISEVVASNDTIVAGSSQLTVDFVELYNTTSEPVDLSGCGLSDSLKRPRKWQFPQGTTIYPGEYKIIYLDGNTEASTQTEFHTNFKISRAGGETICFCDPNGRVLDRIPLDKIPTDHSYGRTIGLSGFYYYDSPTPGAANGTGYYGYAATPSFSVPGGEYKGTLEVSIEVPEGCVVYYSTDGSIPTQEYGIRYNGETFTLNSVTVLRARAFDPTGRLEPGDTITQTYLMNLYHSFPIVSLVADPDELWNEKTGMLTVGENVDKSNGIPFKNTVYREYGKIARAGHVEFYRDGEQVLSQDCEFGLQGQYSLDMPQKTFKVKAKAKYGSKYFNAKLFEDRDFTEYKSFVLRMSGNDCVWTRINDVWQGVLIDRFNEITDTPSTVIHQAWSPVVVYLNGMYWGHYNLRERVDRYFVAQHEGLSLEEADNMDILEASGKVNYGSAKEYKAMIEHVKKSSPGTNAEDLQYILDRIDVDNYFDYMAFEMFFGNSDPGNIRYYKLNTEGSKWRWIIYDLDYGMFRSGFDSPTSYLKESGAGQQKIDNTLLRKLLENDEMLDKFLTRLGEIYQVFTTEFMLEVFNECAATIEPEMQLHFARWAEENDKAINVDSPLTPEGAMRYWNTRLDYTRNVIKKRPTYFYEMVQEHFGLSDSQMLVYFGVKPELPADATYTEGKKWG